MVTIKVEYKPVRGGMEADRRTVENDNARRSTKLLLDLSKRIGDRVGVRDVNGDGNQTLLLKRFPRPDGDLIPLLLQLVRDGETDVTSSTNNESSWRHCAGRNGGLCVVGEVMSSREGGLCC